MPKPSPYKVTIELPKTPFPIQYAHEKMETQILQEWEQGKITQQILHKNESGPKFFLHDGPPYPNGNIHLGHALNKILKDIIVKYKLLLGHFAPYIPGWDCHGLPIESQLLKELGGSRKEMDVVTFRKKCQEYALRYVDIQRTQFIRLGVLGDWQHPYLTLQPQYEAGIVELLGKLAEDGYVYRGRKPIHWCIHCETALAEAEIEYDEKESPSVYVKFPVAQNGLGHSVIQKNPELAQKPIAVLIWTTTPWTLPANVAVAVHPQATYAFVDLGREIVILAESLRVKLSEILPNDISDVKAVVTGKEIEGLILNHPFAGREVPVVLAPFVTMEDGTGCVHIAPGHGQEDYQIGLQYKLPMVMPVDAQGKFTKDAGEFAGLQVFEGNQAVIDRLQKDGHLLAQKKIRHSYPHCWRCGNPVIFRATEQWFIVVDHQALRQKSLSAIDNVRWYPPWGERRIRSMMELRPDWCISRQRSWGIPIPAFYCENEKCGEVIIAGKFNAAVVEVIAQEGTNAWFQKDAEELLGPNIACPKCGGHRFRKETDILDVWFESGGSHFAVQKLFGELRFPADLYLEGSDQHRGWFQSSLITSQASSGAAPFRSVLTHGFTVDEQGRKMSKSLGNVVDPLDVVKEYGADVLRLWVASSDFSNDVAASPHILKQVQEAYGKMRNTCRFLCGNLRDFDPERDAVAHSDLTELDRYTLIRLHKMVERIRRAYDQYEFHIVFHVANEFCTNDLSAFYLDVVKDRLYCDGRGSPSRRSVQTVLYQCLMHLMVLLAPILSFTMEELRAQLPASWRVPSSIFLFEFPQTETQWLDKKLEEKWDALLRIRAEVYQLLEKERAAKRIGSSLEAAVTLTAESELWDFLQGVKSLLPSTFIVSAVDLLKHTGKVAGGAVPSEQMKSLWISVGRASGERCERCWIYSETIGKHHKHPTLCDRCGGVVDQWYNSQVLQEFS